jgi:CBS domain-containing protein
MIDASTRSRPVLDHARLVGIVAREDVLRGLRRAAQGHGAGPTAG